MNILFITLRADFGGGPQHLDLLINNLTKEYIIYLACPNDRPYYYNWKNNINVKDIFILPHRKFSVVKLLCLLKYIKEKKIEIIHSHGKGAGIYSRLIKLFYPKIMLIHTYHGIHLQTYNSLKKFLYIIMERLLYYLTDFLINVSNGEKEVCISNKLIPRNSNKNIVIYNAVNKLNKINDAKIKLYLDNKFVITTISRFDYQKNMQQAYKIAEYFKNDKNIIFLWIGDGEDKEALEKLANNNNVNIFFTGFTRDIELYLSATDLYLSTSRWEGLPIALIEALSLGIPIIASNVVGNREVVLHGKTGYLFKNVEKAIKFINLLKNNVDLYKTFSYNALEFFTNFNIQQMIEKLEKIYLSNNNLEDKK